MKKRIDCAVGYFLLLLLSLPIALVQLHLTDHAFEVFRPYGYGGLLPANILFLRGLGDWAMSFPVAILCLYLASFRFEIMGRSEVIGSIAMILCAFSTLYSLLAIMTVFVYAPGR